MVTILDGWGISFIAEGNAIAAAKTPTMDEFLFHYPAAAIAAAGEEVGLPWGEVGDSETGHKNIGAGSVQYQTLEGINHFIADGSFFKNPLLESAFQHARERGSQLHLIGLVSPGGVHSHMNHLFALLDAAMRQKFRERVYVHLFTDGRDTPPKAALTFLAQLEEKMGKYGVGTIASVSGRFYAMDRNKNWDRTQAAYDMLTGGPRGSGAPGARQAIENAYAENVLDEMIPATAITRGGAPIAEIQDGDAVVFFNFRPDRARQLTAAFVQPETVPFKTKKFQDLLFVTFAKYDSASPAPAIFVEQPAEYPLARVLSESGLTQFHIAETEKYAHITYYLNVGHEKPFPGEEHVLIESSSVKNFADQPQMAAQEITDRTIAALQEEKFDVIFMNYANSDMVGHTGNLDATIEACTFVDTCLARLHEAVKAAGGVMLVTADHGNAEEKINHQTGEVSTDHTANPVPFYYVNEVLRRTTPKSESETRDILSSPIGVLGDVAPTILEILELQKPPQMTGVSLLNSLR